MKRYGGGHDMYLQLKDIAGIDSLSRQMNYITIALRVCEVKPAFV